MLGALKRVVSGENINQVSATQEEQHQPQPSSEQPSFHPPNSDITTLHIVDPMDVEEDEQNDNNKNNSTDDYSIGGSSISDISAGGKSTSDNPMVMVVDERNNIDYDTKMTMQTSEPPPVVPNDTTMALPKAQLARADSNTDSSYGRQSSQTSDYGWFEDVHVSTEQGNSTPTLKRTKPDHYHHHHHHHHQASTTPLVMMEQANTAATGPGTLRKGMTLLPHLALTGESSDEMQQVLLDPPLDLEHEARAMAVTAPNYVLEESLSSQKLWKDTAGNRPPQPIEERAFFERMWAANFANSQVHYQMPPEVLTATTPISMSPFADGNFGAKELSNYNLGNADGTASHGAGGGTGKQQDVAEVTLVSRLHDPSHHSVVSGMSGGADSQHHHLNHEVVNRKIKGSTSDEDLTVLIKGDNVFGTTVSKSFAKPGVYGGPLSGVDTVNISIASYRVVESRKRGKYAQFLVIYREGSIRDTIGVWKRYSDFQRLSEKVTKAHEGCAAVIANMSPLAVTEEHDVEHLPNAITSWRLLKKRQRWYRCLDAGYLSLKVFLLERFLHDILFESSTPDLLRDFVKGEEE